MSTPLSPADRDEARCEHTLTSEQRAAVETPGNLVVRAGAGSGKTRVLVERYVRLVCGAGAEGDPSPERGPFDVEQVLAVTFTEKAAAEMRERIRARVTEEVRRAAAGTGRDRLVRVQRQLAAARISTIHALAASLTKAHPFESGVDPGAMVLDEIEAASYLERESERMLLAALRAGDADVRQLAALWGVAPSGQAVGLVDVVVTMLATLGRRGRTIADLEPALLRQEVAADEAARSLHADAARLVALGDAWVDATMRDAKRAAEGEQFLAGWSRWRRALAALDPAAPVATLLAVRELPLAIARPWRREDAGQEADRLLSFKLEGGTPRFRGAIPEAYGLCQGLPLARALTRVLVRAAHALADAKRRDAVLTFDDLIASAVRLLAEHPTVASRETARLQAILVDEFQDTDPAQHALLRRLAAGGAELFVVGDEKQSIYRFRGAEVGLFAEMRHALGHELSLRDSFRAVPPLVAFVNGLAAQTLAAPPSDGCEWRVAWSPEQRLRPRRARADDGPVVRVKSLVNAVAGGARELSAATTRAHEARVVAATIVELVGEGRRFGGIAVLLPALTQVKAYEYALRRFGVPYQVVRGRGFFECQEIRDLTSLLATVADPTDGVALATALRSPLFGFDDELLLALAAGDDGRQRSLARRFAPGERFDDLAAPGAARARAARELFDALRGACDRRPVAELLLAALAATRFESVLIGQWQGEQKVANVRKLVEQARAFQRGRHATTRDFVARLTRLIASEPREAEAGLAGDADAVRVMSIHQAKGLEFDVVVLPDLGREIPRDYRSPVVMDDRYGTLVVPTFGAGRYRLPHRLVEAWRVEDLQRAAAERNRLFYVACTRARDLLVLCEGKGKRTFLQAGAQSAPRTWCEHIWSFLGREAVATFVAGAAERTILTASGRDADGEEVPVAVEIEKSAAVLTRVRPDDRDAAASGVAAALAATPGAEERAHAARVYDAVPPPPAELVVSPSALADFATCPRQFFYRHVLAFPEATAAAPAVRMGIAAHGVLEMLALDRPVTEHAAAVGAALATMPNVDAAERAELARDLCAVLARHAEVDGDLVVLGRELAFCLPLAGSPALLIRGRIDLLAGRGDQLLVRDYKYARPQVDAEAHRVPMEIYALAVAQGLPDRGVAAEIEYLRGAGARVAIAIDLTQAAGRARATGAALAAALERTDAEAFPRAFTGPAACRDLGCAYVARCFGRA